MDVHESARPPQPRNGQSKVRPRGRVWLLALLLGALIAGAAMAPDGAAAQVRLTPHDIVGRWCGTQADYVISRRNWLMHHHGTGWRVKIAISRFTFGRRVVIIHWANLAGPDGQTVFTRLDPMGPTFYQPDIGETFRRC